MPRCNKSEGQAMEYAAKLLLSTEAAAFERHIKNCSDCSKAVESFTTLLNLTDMAENEVTVPEAALQDIEMNVYKRLATTQEESVPSRIRGFFANIKFLFQWRKTAAAGTFVVALITAAVLVGEWVQPKMALQLTEAQSADARIEHYLQQDIQRHLEDALITHHLRNDTWQAESHLERFKEQAQGNPAWMKVAQTLHVSPTQAAAKEY